MIEYDEIIMKPDADLTVLILRDSDTGAEMLALTTPTIGTVRPLKETTFHPGIPTEEWIRLRMFCNSLFGSLALAAAKGFEHAYQEEVRGGNPPV